VTIIEALPIACTLVSGQYKDRVASIAALNKDALRKFERRNLVLELRYAPEARGRVQEMVRNEQICCAFLDYDLREIDDEICLIITAPESAREAADTLFDQFVANAQATVVKTVSKKPPGTKAAGVTAVTLATGAIACGACCVLPFTLPATVLASTGSLLSSFVRMHWWITALSVLAVLGAWGWIAWQTRRTGRKPSFSTLLTMAASMTVSLLWPFIEKPLFRALRA